ncbi:MAG: hypothetical protein ACYTAS_15055 [Planctomycetota bacterium]|jgi:hypothetical protein
MSDRYITDRQQLLTSLARQGSENRKETSFVVSPEAAVRPWPVKVKSHVSKNVYSVRAVVVGETGTVPSEIGAETEATNMAESFLATGTLSAGTYVIMFRAGERNIFYAVP